MTRGKRTHVRLVLRGRGSDGSKERERSESSELFIFKFFLAVVRVFFDVKIPRKKLGHAAASSAPASN